MLSEINLEQVTLLYILQFFLVFCRMGSAVMLLPGVGEIYVSASIRLIFALLLSLIMMPLISGALPQNLPSGGLQLFVLISGEILIGIFLGSFVRIMLSMMHVAGMVIAFQSSLSSAMLFDTTQGSQGSVIGVFMTILAVTILFTSNMHHMMLKAFADSYEVFPLLRFPDIGDMADAIAKLVSHGFDIGIRIAAPMIVVTLLIYVGGGIISRLMPQMQVFFVLIPVQIVITFLVMMMTLSAAMIYYLHYYEDTILLLAK